MNEPSYTMVAVDMATGRWRPAVDQAVDDYLLMERKAQAWDELRVMVGRFEQSCPVSVAQMDNLVRPAQEPSTR